jgi:hypothetical protein
MNRRQFAYVTALSGAVAGTRAEGAAAQPGRIPEAAGLITEMVFLDDCIRVAMYQPALSEAAKNALAEYSDFVRNGALAPAGSARTAQQFALTAGRLCSEALNRRRRPNSAEARLYQDIAVMRDLAAAAGCDPDKPGPVADLLDVLHVRRRLGLHTLIPDDENLQVMQAWLSGVCAWWKDQRDLRAALGATYSSPDSAKMREFAAGFYDAKHPLIKLARGFQFGQLVPPAGLPAALEQARQGGGYARALADAAEALQNAPQPV